MATAPLDDELWKLIEPLLPVRKRRLHRPGRKRIDNRRARRSDPAASPITPFASRVGVIVLAVGRLGGGAPFWAATAIRLR